MKTDLRSRRMFLQGSGSALLAIPFLPSLERTAAAAAPPPLKYVHISSNLNLPRALTVPLYKGPKPSYPQPAGTTPDSVPWVAKDADTRYQSLKDIVAYQGKLSWTFDEQWNPFVSRMNLVTNTNAYTYANNHPAGIQGACSNGKSANLWSAEVWGPTPAKAFSVDWLMEQFLSRDSSSQLPVLRLNLYDHDGGYQTFCFGTVNGAPARLPMMQSLGELSLKISGRSGRSAGGQGSQSRLARIDSVLDDFNALIAHRRISSVDRHRLGDAADLWRGIEKRLQTGAPAAQSCALASPAMPSQPNWGMQHRVAMDTVAAALACGITRNVAYGLIQGDDATISQNTLHGWEHDPRQGGESGPSLSDAYFKVIRWRSNLVTYFLSKLDSLKDEAGQSLINSSLAVWAHQYSDYGHDMFGYSLVAVGGANGKLDMGWHVDAGMAPINRFHLTNMMAMGLGLAEIEKNGDPGFGEIAQPANTGDGTNKLITGVQVSKLSYFSAASEMRKPYPYLKS